MDSSSFASSGALHRDPAAHFACSMESLFMVAMAVDVDFVDVGASGLMFLVERWHG
jgi:hypothetical protein